MNIFHDKLVASQHVAVSFLATSLINNSEERDEQQGELAKMLLSMAQRQAVTRRN
jgi:hypothetical protein